MGDRDLAERIRADRIDVLIDLSGHTAGNRLTAFIHRPARVQATWLGYLSTTGLTQIDYRITDAALDPEGMTERLHTEALWRLPETSWCYAPYPESPDVTARGSDAALTFISLNNPGKCSPTVMMLWARILNEVPQSRLIVQTSPHPSRVDAVARFFEQHGVDATRLEQVARRPLRDYLALYGRADIALDSWPYTGGTTTCDALWMGVPVVSLATDRPFARSGAGMLSVVGLPDLIAADGEDYVRKSVGLARDPRRLATLRDSLRTRMQRSPMTDKVAFARAFERALRDMHARAVTR
jgi:predicted O-linked N-acetylglucosamine transferase (SPINDLY family)